jgi:hypothetical protein
MRPIDCWSYPCPIHNDAGHDITAESRLQRVSFYSIVQTIAPNAYAPEGMHDRTCSASLMPGLGLPRRRCEQIIVVSRAASQILDRRYVLG